MREAKSDGQADDAQHSAHSTQHFPTRVRVLLADDHALLREGLRGLLDGQPDFEVVGEAGDGVEAVERAGQIMPDLVLMDVDMPVMDGLAATERIKATLPSITIVMLTVHDADDKLFAAIRAGAQGYLLKDIHGPELIEALRGLARGEAPISRRLAARLLHEFAQQPPTARAASALTPRETEILQMVAARMRNKEIADALFISEFTVKNHLRNILAKLHRRNRREAAALARQQGLIAEPPERARD
jgi:DNA-binding NarL/FixJ family response regulator